MITTALTDAFRLAQLDAVRQANHAYYMALYGPDATLGPDTPSYMSHGECVGEGYERGGRPLEGCTVRLIDGVACLDWQAPTWDPVTIDAAGFLIYNRSVEGLPSVLTHAFDRVYRATNGPFQPQLPPPGPDTSLIQWPRPATSPAPSLTGDLTHAEANAE